MGSCKNTCQVGLILWERPCRGLCSSRNHISRHSPYSKPRPELSQPAAAFIEAKSFTSTLCKLVNQKRDYTSSRTWQKDQGGWLLQEQRRTRVGPSLGMCGPSASHSSALWVLSALLKGPTRGTAGGACRKDELFQESIIWLDSTC